jgi:6-phosphogluconolactonase (cycloisomerase 2 family)
LGLVDAAPAGGSFPRQFSVNAAENQIAVAVQTNGWVAVLERDTETWRVGGCVAVQLDLGMSGVVCVLWDERKLVSAHEMGYRNGEGYTM